MTKKFILNEWWGSKSTKRVGEIKDSSMVVKPNIELIDLFQSFENRIESLEQKEVDKPKRNFEILFANHETVLIKISKEIGKHFHVNIDFTSNTDHLIHVWKEYLHCSKEEFYQALQEFKNK